MPHNPEWHVLDSSFPDGNKGLVPPLRKTSHGAAQLTLESLDRTDPPRYSSGNVPRDATFNRNVFRLAATPCMPSIHVVCAVQGFDPSHTPIQWRLVCRHVLCRYTNVGQFRYRGATEVFEREWRGESHTASFDLFTPNCSYSYNDQSRVLGGHALLIVAVRVDGATLSDYVHLRIEGANPTQAEVFAYLSRRLEGYDPNVVRMVRAIFRHESAFTQFASAPQRAAAMTFSRRHHAEATQPDCRVRFDWPDDPPNFPLASFDFGVGISQFTEVGSQRVTAEIGWDWRENIRLGTNLFLGKLRKKYQAGMTWKHLALAAWAAYNGAGAAAERYARQLAISDEGAQVSMAPVASVLQVALLDPAPSLAAPQPWLIV